MTTKTIRLDSRCGASASFRASTNCGRKWSVSRISFGFLSNSHSHVGNGGSLEDCVAVAKASWNRTASKVTIK